MPFEAGRVGQHAEFVLINVYLLVYYLDYDLPACRVGDAPVYGRCARVNGYHVHVFQSGHGLVYRLEVAEYP